MPAASSAASTAGSALAPLSTRARRLRPSMMTSRSNDGDVLRQVVSLLEVVRGEHDGQPILACQPGDLAPHVRTRLRIKAGGRLIQEQHLRLVDEAHRHVELALHAAGEGTRDALARVREVKALKQTGNAPPQLGAGQAVELALQRQVLGHRGLKVYRRLLRHEADHAAHALRLAHDVAAGDAGAPCGGPGERREDLNNSGLARAVGPESREHGTWPDAEADAFERLDAARIGLRESLGLDSRPRNGGRGRAARPGWLDGHGKSLFSF